MNLFINGLFTQPSSLLCLLLIEKICFQFLFFFLQTYAQFIAVSAYLLSFSFSCFCVYSSFCKFIYSRKHGTICFAKSENSMELITMTCMQRQHHDTYVCAYRVQVHWNCMHFINSYVHMNKNMNEHGLGYNYIIIDFDKSAAFNPIRRATYDPVRSQCNSRIKNVLFPHRVNKNMIRKCFRVNLLN